MRSYSTHLTALAALLAVSVLSGCSKPEAAPEPIRAVRTMTLASDSAGAKANLGGNSDHAGRTGLAWLAVFGLLFAYRGKIGELGSVRQQLHSVSNSLAQWDRIADML